MWRRCGRCYYVSFLVVLASCRQGRPCFTDTWRCFVPGASGKLQTCEKHRSIRRRRGRWQDKRLHTFDVPERLRRFPLILRFLFAGYLLVICWLFAGYLLALAAAEVVKSLELIPVLFCICFMWCRLCLYCVYGVSWVLC